MEILIPGLILVALMVYASTRIKKSAARAYEPETIETDDYIIQKPEGFLYVIGGDPSYEFEAYSRNFGTDGAEELRQGTARLKVHTGREGDDVASGVLHSDDAKISDGSEIVGGVRYRTIEADRTDKGVRLIATYKLAEKSGKVFEFETVRLIDTTADFARNIETMINSFEIK